METYRLAYFAPDDGSVDDEYVVILSPGTRVEDFIQDGFSLIKILEISGDATAFPCDRELSG